MLLYRHRKGDTNDLKGADPETHRIEGTEAQSTSSDYIDFKGNNSQELKREQFGTEPSPILQKERLTNDRTQQHNIMTFG